MIFSDGLIYFFIA
jgi:hypothetical protein